MDFEQSYKIFEAYFRTNSIIKSQLQSFNWFITFGIQHVIEGTEILAPGYSLRFGQVSLPEPRVIEENRAHELSFPMKARLRDLNYDTSICCDLIETFTEQEETKERKHTRVCIGRLPIMLKSAKCNLTSLSDEEQIRYGECPNDPGGYFIIRGNERVLVGQMRTSYNEVFVLPGKPNDKYKWYAETRSMSPETGHSILLQSMIGVDDRTLVFSLPYIKEPIPVGVVFKALGFVNDEDIVNLIGLDFEKTNKYIRFILRDSFFCHTQEEALAYIGQFTLHITDKKSEYAYQVVETELLPHIGISGSVKEQASFLGHMVRRMLMTHIGMRKSDDRDSYSNKRVEVAGNLLFELFRHLFKKYLQEIKKQLAKRKQIPDILSLLSRIKIITDGLHRCMASGNWSVQKNASYMRTGVSQIVDRMTYMATISHLRRILIPIGKEGKNAAMRQIHSSQFGFICPAECFHPMTKILTWDGTIKLAKDIVIGDTLIDDKGKAITVKSTCSGTKKMYTILHTNRSFKDYTVTDNHILTLKSTEHNRLVWSEEGYKLTVLDKESMSYKVLTFPFFDHAQEYCKTLCDKIVDITIDKYNSLPFEMKCTLKMFKCPNIEWEEKETEIDPYMFGLKLRSELESLNDVRIPIQYIKNSRQNRLQLLHGLVPKPGDKLKVQDNQEFMNDLTLLCHSVGFDCRVEGSEVAIVNDCVLESDFFLVQQEEQSFVGWQVHGSGRFLLSDCTVTHNTPEGHKVGVVLNFALLAHVTRRIPTVDVRRVLDTCKTFKSVEDTETHEMKNMTPVFLNGGVIGFTNDGEDTATEIRELRRRRLLDYEVSVTYDMVDNNVRIFCDEGRFIRPLLTLKDNKLRIPPINTNQKYDWDNLMKVGFVQYLDASEIENIVIGMTPKILDIQRCDYCEIHPTVMLGIVAAMIPFSDHSQSPRNCYQSSMGKQALGIPLLSYNLRTDTLLHVLYYPQKQMVSTMHSKILGISDMPSGINAMVAVLMYTGFNQEDSLMLNRSSTQKGLFCLTSFHTIDCIEKKRDSYSFEDICVPPQNSDKNIKVGEPGYFKRKNANYSFLDENGIILPRRKILGTNGKHYYPRTQVRKGDVIVGKIVTTTSKSGSETKVDASIVIQPGEEGTIDKVYVNITPNGYRLVKVVIRVSRAPTLGDKLASCVAQKGTIGMMYNQEDMPFEESTGIVPDIIMNPLALPSRMTTNQLIATALGKEVAISGEIADATPFTENSENVSDKLVNKICTDLQKYGFEPHGWARMRCGFTGKIIHSRVFFGPTYYQRLKHMVDDKMHARAKGAVTMLTRQPLEGELLVSVYIYWSTCKIEIHFWISF